MRCYQRIVGEQRVCVAVFEFVLKTHNLNFLNKFRIFHRFRFSPNTPWHATSINLLNGTKSKTGAEFQSENKNGKE